ncbi:hypothetical protein JVT61DRAFT_12370 [Boletus reticuloceps]|uniref:Uncharacterized protein n=1 Tax=Boletus reticuloceps TaxID=495285 RepID=A0A8I2YDW2_9AGAM|nr:hypothetical protein JVT61DRAFT_12304 [Boletus reticuloceps]KAG6370219.1 hypothetical protein JVT61DRAFT_12370 [Boletus reticuloceps]
MRLICSHVGRALEEKELSTLPRAGVPDLGVVFTRLAALTESDIELNFGRRCHRMNHHRHRRRRRRVSYSQTCRGPWAPSAPNSRQICHSKGVDQSAPCYGDYQTSRSKTRAAYYLNRVHFDAPMSPLELEIYHQMRNMIEIDLAFYECIFTVDADTVCTLVGVRE